MPPANLLATRPCPLQLLYEAAWCGCCTAGGISTKHVLPASCQPTGHPVSSPLQLLYEATLCCWELSFYRPAADMLCGSTNVVGALVDMVRLAQVRSSWTALLLSVCSA